MPPRPWPGAFLFTAQNRGMPLRGRFIGLGLVAAALVALMFFLFPRDYRAAIQEYSLSDDPRQITLLPLSVRATFLSEVRCCVRTPRV